MMRAVLLHSTMLAIGAVASPLAGVAADAPPAVTSTPAPPGTPPSPANQSQLPPPQAAPQPAPAPVVAAPASPALTATAAARAYECETEAFGMDFEPFKRTKGTIRITLDTSTAEPHEAVPGPAGPIAGRWRVEGAADTHVASIVKLLAETCASGCPFTMTGKGEAQLWAPAPNSLDKLGAKDQLTVAVLKPAPLSVSISTFRGQDIVALEKGACRSTDVGDSGKANPTTAVPSAK